MRLIVTILWIVAAICWTPWFFLLLRLTIDLVLGTSWDDSVYVKPALMGLWPGISFGFWPLWRLASWNVVSLWPLAAILGMILSAVGWRLYWRNEDGILSRPAWLVTASIIAPLLAPFIMWGDARKRHLAMEGYLEHEVQDAKQRLAE